MAQILQPAAVQPELQQDKAQLKPQQSVTQPKPKQAVPQQEPQRVLAQSTARPGTATNLTRSGTVASEDRKIRAFIAMPFSKEFDGLFQSIRTACLQANVQPVRADSTDQPGPIINQIFSEIDEADILIAEIGSANPNVYYEVGLAHCVKKPSILVAHKDKAGILPFDVRHNRVIVFDDRNDHNMTALVSDLTRSISKVKDTITGGPQTLEGAVRDTSVGRSNLKDLVREVGAVFDFQAPQLVSSKPLQHAGDYMVEIKDEFSGERAKFIYDVNGNIRDRRLVERG